MSILVLTSDTLIGTPATGNLEYNGQFFGTDSAGSRAQLQRIVRATAVASTSGTSIDFTGIPAWVEKITVMFSSVSLNSTGAFLIQLGDSGGVETSGYDATLIIGSNGSANTVNTSVAGFPFYSGANTFTLSGSMIITNITGNTWVEQGVFNNSTTTPFVTSTAGTKTLSATLDRVRITTTTGTDTFDAGTVNIIYEG